MIQIPASVMVAVDKITPSPRNTKKHPQSQINNVAKSIERFGFVQPLVLDENNEIIIGHCRLSASKKLGMKEVPCVYVENLTEEDVRALRIKVHTKQKHKRTYHLPKQCTDRNT